MTAIADAKLQRHGNALLKAVRNGPMATSRLASGPIWAVRRLAGSG